MTKLGRGPISARRLAGAAGLIFICMLAGCNRDEPRVYHISKDDSAPPPPSSDQTPVASQASNPAPAPDNSSSPADAMSSAPPATLPQLRYQLPPGWQEKPPSEMRVASFTAVGPAGQSADISAIPLPIVGRDQELINMWRSQVQLPPTTDPNAAQQARTIAIGGDQGRLFEFVSDHPMIGKSRQRIMIAMLTHGMMSWFFKMGGEDEFVTSQKANFLQFLKSVSFDDSAPQAMTASTSSAAAPAMADTASSIWTVPADWKSVPPSQFLLAEYSVPSSSGAKAEVNVAEMGGGGGGLLANVNRWRGQLGLTPLGGDDLARAAQPLNVSGADAATLIDFTGTNAKTGTPARLVGAIVQQGGQTWFYKLMGDKETVAQQKDAFRKFVESANYANAR
ncbi:MAG TPA: hypothetical protein VHY09_06060 [Candidatus Methylacidiphilales bacterium]|nr:hypothetical protein [Candidatus Methylacidiphilales bacterium]